MPLVAPMARDGSGNRYLNVNADDVAAAVAAALAADELVFLSDVPGVLADDGSVIAEISASAPPRRHRRHAAEARGLRRGGGGRRRPGQDRCRHGGDAVTADGGLRPGGGGGVQTTRTIVERGAEVGAAHLPGAADRVRPRQRHDAVVRGRHGVPRPRRGPRGGRRSGHAHPAPIEAFARQAATLGHVSNLYWTEPGVALAERLLELCELDGGAFFCNSGAEANEAAIKLARRRGRARGGPDKHRIVCLEGSFHGRTLATLQATWAREKKVPFEPLPAGFAHVRPERPRRARGRRRRLHRGDPARAGAGRGRRASARARLPGSWRASSATATTRC